MRVSTGILGVQRLWIPGAGVTEVRSDLMWMLGTKLWSSGAAANVRSSEPSIQLLGFTFSFYCEIYLLSTWHSESS